MHMVFTGNPGTAKTTVARLIGQILAEENILPAGGFIEVGKSELVGPAVGTTPIIVKDKFRKAKGGVLFIDEAYSLLGDPFGEDAINTIVQEMENNREDTVVIFAGYPDLMADFLKRNPDLKVELAGHTDDVGNASYNLKLSSDRAEVVRRALIDHGIEESRLTAHGYGATKPLVPNDSDEHRALNRRTEMVVIN